MSINMSINDEKKKRGRPRKNMIFNNNIPNIIDTRIDTSKIQENIIENKKELILHLKFKKNSNKEKKKSKEDSNKSNEKLYIYSYKKRIKNLEDIIINLKKENENLKKEKINNRLISDDEYKNSFIKLNIFDNKTQNEINLKKTKIHCWWCCHSFSNYPCFIPDKYINKKYYVFGCFCSFNCSLSYVFQMDDKNQSSRILYLKKFIKELFGDKEFYPAKNKETINTFGGNYTIEEFRKEFLTIKESKIKNIEIYPVYVK